jgi:hypothetical protein
VLVGKRSAGDQRGAGSPAFRLRFLQINKILANYTIFLTKNYCNKDMIPMFYFMMRITKKNSVLPFLNSQGRLFASDMRA